MASVAPGIPHGNGSWVARASQSIAGQREALAAGPSRRSCRGTGGGPGQQDGRDIAGVPVRRVVGTRGCILRHRLVVALADRPAALDAVVRITVDDHEVERVDARLLVRVAPGDPALRARPA